MTYQRDSVRLKVVRAARKVLSGKGVGKDLGRKGKEKSNSNSRRELRGLLLEVGYLLKRESGSFRSGCRWEQQPDAWFFDYLAKLKALAGKHVWV
jgi:hypothetical protein